MSLINCPECGKQISDKALSCPNCGYPIMEIKNTPSNAVTRYNIYLKEVFNNDAKIKIIGFLRGTKKLGLSEAKKITDNLPQKIYVDIPLQEATSVKRNIESFGAVVQLVESNELESADNQEIPMGYNDSTIVCPHCGSTSVTTGQRGFSLLTGFLGSNKTVNRCGKCGWTWQPK